MSQAHMDEQPSRNLNMKGLFQAMKLLQWQSNMGEKQSVCQTITYKKHVFRISVQTEK